MQPPVRPNGKAGAKDTKKTLLKLKNYSQKYTIYAIIAIVLSFFTTIATLIGPSKLSIITDEILAGINGTINLEYITEIAIFLGIIFIISSICGYYQNFMMSNVTQKISKQMRKDISSKINKLPLKYFDKSSIGDTLSRITNDVDLVSQTLNQVFNMLFSAATLFIGSLVMMIYTNWILALTAVVATIGGTMLMRLIMGTSQVHFKEVQATLGQLNGHIEESYSAHNVIKAYSAGSDVRSRFGEVNSKIFNHAWKSQFISGLMMPIMIFSGNLSYVLVCIVGSILTMNDVITFGVIVSFTIYVRLFSQPLSQMAQVATNMQSAIAASERIFEFIDEEELADESHKTTVLNGTRGDVSFQNVSFSYTPDKMIINDFSCEINAGQKIAIVGPTGAGKTTIVNLLMRFYEINSGKILIDGVSIADITRENLHDVFCMVLQDTWIFEGTIRENIVYSKPGVSDEDVVNVCKNVGLHHFIGTLPKGYDTILNEKVSLSAGQRQLITIARAMIEDAPILILDEATSSVDTRTEMLIQRSMDALAVGRTSFVIAHRLSTIKNADVILVMKDGDIIESGNHDVLLAQNGFYATLYNSQFEEN